MCGVVVAGSAATSMSMNREPEVEVAASIFVCVLLSVRELVLGRCSFSPCSPILLSCGFLHYLKSVPAHEHSVTQVLACYMDDGAPTISMHASVYI